MLGFLKPKTGTIHAEFLGQKNIVEVASTVWRKSVGYVPQNVYILNGTFADNICFGGGDKRDMKNFEIAIDRAQLRPIFSSFAEGGEQFIGEDGNKLSGGERQRIGIARALYRKPSLLFFDEATSALDGYTERAVLQTIEKLRGTVTTITIAHRISTVKNCDAIYLLENGSIVASGNYTQLCKNSSKFRNLVNSVSKVADKNDF